MKIKLLLTFLLLCIAGCGQDHNSNSSDDGQYSPIGANVEAALRPSYIIMQGKCFQCHGSWVSYTTSDQWVNSGLIVRGNSLNSKLTISLKNMGGNMPPDPIAPLTAEQYNTVTTWIDAL